MKIFFNFTLLFIQCFIIDCLYEDQTHKWDWKTSLIGINVNSCLRSAKFKNELIFCSTSDSNVISALNSKSSEIVWRNVQESTASLKTSGLTRDEAIITASHQKDTKETKLFLRKWSTNEQGYLINEKIINLNDNLSKKDCVFSINGAENVVQMICMDSDDRKIFIHSFFMEPDSQNDNDNVKVLNNLPNHPTQLNNIENSCIIIDNKAFVCFNSDSLFYLILDKTEWNIYKLPFQLDVNSKIIIEQVVNEEGIDEGFFTVKIYNQENSNIKLLLFQFKSDQLEVKAEMNTVAKMAWLNDKSLIKKFFTASEVSDGIVINTYTLDNFNKKPSESIFHKIDSRFHSSSIEKLFVLKNKKSVDILLVFSDQRLISLNLDGSLKWSREESLSSIISTIFISLPYFSSLPSFYLDSDTTDFLIISSFLKRIYSQVNSVQIYFSSFLHDIYSRSHKKNHTQAIDESHFISDKFGFHKLIFTLTKFGKIYLLDNNRKGAIISSYFDAQLREEILKEETKINLVEKNRSRKCEKSYPLWVYLQRSNSFSPMITIVTKNGYILSFNPLTDVTLDKHNLNIQVKQTLLMHHADEKGIKGILIVDEKDWVHFYPSSTKVTFTAHKDNYYLLVVQQSSELIQGYSFNQIKNENQDTVFRAQRVWSFSLPPLSKSCLKIGWKEREEHVHSQGKLISDISVLYKYLNPNLVVIINEGEEKNDEESGGINVVHFYLVDAITGAVYYSVIHRKASGPVHIVHSENFIIYSFYNERQRRIEISSLELFEGKEMPSPPPVRIPPQIVEHISFIFPTGIRTMKETRTEKGITNKHILIALSSGAILSFPKVFLDPRRASLSSSRYSSSTAANEEGGVYLPPYIPELPIPSEAIINYNQTLSGIKVINVAVSSLESTCLVFITGLDLYYTRVTPSKTFDILKDDFDHLLIIIVLLTLLFFSLITKYLASRKTLKAAWK